MILAIKFKVKIKDFYRIYQVLQSKVSPMM